MDWVRLIFLLFFLCLANLAAVGPQGHS
jgi:hypothetical protein